ncbi:MAG TPA: ubiquinol oxidase subunit II [Candidatus Dormibacteraeota bacterium]|nr:ubiquinol oxidase subunit II [Candidatus Dormibacteraeota bacterium]
MKMNKKYKVILVVVLLVAILLVASLSLRQANIAVLNPQGPIAESERRLIIIGLLLSLVVVIPVFSLLFIFAWKYREDNKGAKYSPELDHNLAAEAVWWLIPGILIVILSFIAWNSSHQLDPFKPLVSQTAPITIQVVALDWKWLFIYPKQNIASLNFVQFPVNTPLNLMITADAPMNSFWIPQLGGQIYAMPGMSTQLHLMATKTGNFRGLSANISGQGFSGMSFTARASSPTDFNSWIVSVKRSSKRLNLDTYNQLSKPSQNSPLTYFSSTEPDLYNSIIMKFMMPMGAQASSSSYNQSTLGATTP